MPVNHEFKDKASKYRGTNTQVVRFSRDEESSRQAQKGMGKILSGCKARERRYGMLWVVYAIWERAK